MNISRVSRETINNTFMNFLLFLKKHARACIEIVIATRVTGPFALHALNSVSSFVLRFFFYFCLIL